MGVFFEVDTVFEVLCGFVLVFWLVYLNLTKEYGYWETKNIPYIQPSFPFGCTKDAFLGRTRLADIYDSFYKQFKGEPLVGIYELKKPVLIVKDPQIIKYILTKDFHHFQDRFQLNINDKIDYIAKHLFNMGGQEWKDMRTRLSPTFTSGKIKMMFLLMDNCGKQLMDYVSNETSTSPVIDIKDVLSRFTMNIIATCAFGLEVNALDDSDSEFYHHGVQIFRLSRYRMFKRIMSGLFPSIFKISGLRLVSKELTDFFTRIVQDTVEYREKNNINRNDFLNLLIQIRQNKSLTEDEHLNGNSEVDQRNNKQSTIINSVSGLTIEEMTAQAFVFFAAGFETASSTMTFCLYEVAQHPEVQEKLYQEVKDTLEKHGGTPTYQALQELPYMDMVINETLRRYSSLSFLNRRCTKTYKIPDTDVVIEKGQSIVIPIYSIHHDPQYYDEPFKFDPERFSPEQVKDRHPYVHLPFGEGPRICIGMRFGLLQTKIGLTQMILNFKFGLTPATEIPVQFNKTSFVTLPQNPICLHLSKRDVV